MRCATPPPAGVGCLVSTAGQQIRLKGRNLTECEHVKLGAYHTLELELHRAFTLHKVWVGGRGGRLCRGKGEGLFGVGTAVGSDSLV